MNRLRTLAKTFLVDGMRKYLVDKLSGTDVYVSIDEDDDLEISKFFTGWLSGDESVFPGFVDFIENNGITLTELRMQAYREVADDLELVDNQMARHQKNVRELLKLIEMRRNNKLARQRLEQEMERLSAKTLVVEHDDS